MVVVTTILISSPYCYHIKNGDDLRLAYSAQPSQDVGQLRALWLMVGSTLPQMIRPLLQGRQGRGATATNPHDFMDDMDLRLSRSEVTITRPPTTRPFRDITIGYPGELVNNGGIIG